ncbi:MAG: hypothetical protein EOO39_22685 [Cytophagaceae bacterium]|nr:MAG: hypothetical protein EOO39_22685 [Cytophagaceae bacterium]
MDFDIKYAAGEARTPFAGSGGILIDPAFAQSQSYISTFGRAEMHTYVSVLAHEIGHAISFNSSDADATLASPKGTNVTIVNTWYAEMGLSPGIPQLAAYNAQDISNNYTTLGKDYTDGNHYRVRLY